MTIFNRVKEIDGDTYVDRDGDEVELLWDDVWFTNDDGEEIKLCVYVNEDDTLKALEKHLWDGTFKKVDSPTIDMIEQYDPYYNGGE